MSRQVVYVGCGVSGKCASLASVLRASVRESEWRAVDCYLEHAFEFPRDGGVRVTASVSSRRAVMHYRHISEVIECPAIALEMQRIRSADGFIFVVDSQVARSEHNVDHLQRLRDDLEWSGMSLDSRAVVFQVNKRDLPNTCSLDWAIENMRTARCAYVESVATHHVGTVEAMARLLAMM